MEEEKKQNFNEGNGGGRRKKRHRHHGKKRPQGENAQQAQQGQNNQAQAQKGNKPQPQKGQPQPAQKGQPQQPQKPQQPPQQQKQKNGQNQGKPQQRERDREREKERDKNRQKQEENRKDTYVYTLDGNLYINLTNKCSNGCDFCVRNERSSYYGNYLWLRHGDPTAEKVIAALNSFDLKKYKEIVFCGFGEPTYKVAEMIAVCDYAHEKGLRTRLNTNGQGNLINKRDIVPELKGKIDFVNISLNASCAEKYQPICRSMFGENGFAALIEFARICKREGVDCRFSIVDCIGEEEVEACKKLAASVSVPLYVRKYIIDS